MNELLLTDEELDRLEFWFAVVLIEGQLMTLDQGIFSKIKLIIDEKKG